MHWFSLVAVLQDTLEHEGRRCGWRINSWNENWNLYFCRRIASCSRTATACPNRNCIHKSTTTCHTLRTMTNLACGTAFCMRGAAAGVGMLSGVESRNTLGFPFRAFLISSSGKQSMNLLVGCRGWFWKKCSSFAHPPLHK